MTNLPYNDIDILPGNRRLVGLEQAREQLLSFIRSERLGHAYLIAGPEGSGKKAFALAMAELINGIDNLTDLKGHHFSKKSGWFMHPDIHLFLPLPGKDPDIGLLRERIDLLAKDPYEVVDFSRRPTISDEETSKNKAAFYAISYYRDFIQKAAVLRKNEGYRKVIIITEIEKMRKEAANAFLKLLEEPPKDVMFILTSDNTNLLLPTILSRCQIIRTNPLHPDEIVYGLKTFEGLADREAIFLSKICSGSYSTARFYKADRLREMRDEILQFLRASYAYDAVLITNTVNSWNSAYNKEGLIHLLNLLEVLIRDIGYYKATEDVELLTNFDQAEIIQKFCSALKDARIDEMLEQLNPARDSLRQNVRQQLVFIVLSFRLGHLMRGKDTPLPKDRPHLHMPASPYIS